MGTWYEDTVEAFRNLGGIAHYSDLYEEIQQIRGQNLPISWQAIIRRTIETNSSDSEAFDQRNDVFYSVQGLGKGVWGLRELLVSTPHPFDISEPVLPARARCETYRILRDTALARELKLLHNNQCQVCGIALEISDNRFYSEAHHIKPLGNPHNGPDVVGNILVLCPNHHVQCDYGFAKLNPAELRLHPNHQIEQRYIDYHNDTIFNN